MKLEEVVHRIATDAAFASAVRQDLERALEREGIRLTSAQVAALKAALNGDTGRAARPESADSLDVWHSPQFEPQTS